MVTVRATARGLFLSLFLLFSPLLEARGQESDFTFFRDDLDRESLRRAIRGSLEYLSRLPPERLAGEAPARFTVREVKDSLLSFIEILDLWDRPEVLSEEIRNRFYFYPALEEEQKGDVLFTGYYQPVIEGSLAQSDEFRFPIYRKPADLIEAQLITLRPRYRADKIVGRMDEDRFAPYFSRHEIDTLERLRGKGYEIAWVKDPVELFFLHIQGSGLLKLEDGRLLHLNYHASNGRPYRSIGRILIDRGKLAAEEVSMQRLRRYLLEHPGEMEGLFSENESYVFFRFVENGPLGSLEVPLTRGRSIATDARFFPKGAIAFIMTYQPILDERSNLIGWQPISRFVLNQDTGGAIRGRKRVDIYFGDDEEASQKAGYMRSFGFLYFLKAKE
ncbi:MAG: MltA domain-containing protein [Deltaproteobacteria bacterium]|nr:MltA domain-containing protein [Deltaproteobacteria bacterium]